MTFILDSKYLHDDVNMKRRHYLLVVTGAITLLTFSTWNKKPQPPSHTLRISDTKRNSSIVVGEKDEICKEGYCNHCCCGVVEKFVSDKVNLAF